MSSLDIVVALGCPSCPPVRAARSWVFSDAFWLNVTFAVLPFVVVALVILWIVRRIEKGVGDEEN